MKAKKELKKQVRGVRPIERVVEKRTDEEAAIIRSYCSAVRSALTDDGHPPLAAPGRKACTNGSRSSLPPDAAGGEKRGVSTELEHLHHLLIQGLTTTAVLWPDVQAGYGWVHRVAHLLTNALSAIRQ